MLMFVIYLDFWIGGNLARAFADMSALYLYLNFFPQMWLR